MRTRRRRGIAALVALGAALALALGAAGCSNGDGAGPTPTTEPSDGASVELPDEGDPGSAGTDGSTSTTDTTDPSEGPAAYTAYRDPAQLAADPVAIGERFGLLLEAQPSLGQRWQVVAPPDPAVLAPLGTELTLANAAVPGAPDTQVFSYVGRAAGTTTVSFLEVKADGFQVDGALAVTFTITITPDGLPVPVDEPEDGDAEPATPPGDP